MAPLILANGEMLPETFHFLGLGWWIVHVIAIPSWASWATLSGRGEVPRGR